MNESGAKWSCGARTMQIRIRCCSFSVAVLPLAAMATSVAAEDFTFKPVEQAAPTDWIVTLGADVRGTPRYMGSNQEVPTLSPYFDRHRPGTPEPFHSPRDGTGLPLYENGPIVAGPVGSLIWPRHQHESPSLHGLGDVGATLQLGGYMDYWAARWLRMRVEGMQGFGAANGLTANFAMDAVVPVSPALTLSGGARARADTAAAERPYFSINQAQSNLSGLPTYNASGGLQAVGLGTQAKYRINSTWATYSFVEYDKLVGSTAASPVVSAPGGSTNQWTFGVGLTYSFAMGGLPF
jgi:outer membrane protein